MSNATPSTTDQARRPLRRAGLSAAAISIGLATAALAASAAPSITETPSTITATPSTWALTSDGATGVLEPVMLSAADRAAAAASRSSRSSERGALPAEDEAPADEPEVVGTRFTTAPLNVRTKPKADSKVITVLDPGTKVKITDVKDGDYRQILHKGQARWVTAEYLSKTKPAPKPAGPSSAACASGSGVEAGLRSNTIKVHRAVCNAFPSITSYGGTRGGGGAHGSGRALDIMVSGSAGDGVADYVRAHAGELGVSEVIWRQRIWTVQRAGEGWRPMSDRGSATANHYDHVHVTTY
jgi:Bacterial SH3 domain